MKKIIVLLGATIFGMGVAFWPVKDAQAVSQWARKYKMNCQSCHTAFPRLNHFGEKFARNGYQLPGSEDGDEMKEKINDLTFVDKVSHLFGFRISVSPAEVVTNALDIDGGKRIKFNVGDTKWLQFFTAGSLFKNASIFIETEVEQKAIHFNWFTLGYHNILGTSWLNLRAGELSMLNWAAQTGRLRMIPNIQVEASRSRPSQGAAAAAKPEEPVRYGSPVPALELYGYNDYLLYSVGISNGDVLNDPNQYKNFFGTLRLELPEGELAGSAVTASAMWGRDTANSGTETPAAIAQTRNTFYRLAPGVNLRWKEFDLIGSYFFMQERNYKLSAANDRNNRHGFNGQLGYLIGPRWFAALQYDKVQDSQGSAEEYHKVSENITFMPRENLRIGLTLREELKTRAGGRQHEALLNVRAMF